MAAVGASVGDVHEQPRGGAGVCELGGGPCGEGASAAAASECFGSAGARRHGARVGRLAADGGRAEGDARQDASCGRVHPSSLACAGAETVA